MALTSQSIIVGACQIAKCPGMTLQAGDFLNEILSTLAQNYDLPEASQRAQFPIGPLAGTGVSPAQPFQYYPLILPSGAIYLRTKEAFYNQQGRVFWLDPLLPEQYDRLFQGQGINNYPYWFTVDTSTDVPQVAFYPPANISLTIFVRAQFQPADIVDPVNTPTIPWFRNRRFLVTRLAADLMQITGDTRRAEFDTSATDQLRKYLLMVGDKENVATTVKLDPLRFRNPSGLAPTKQTGF